ncbi:MAG: right-handed parallel beta-helix repeat-containing protein, partial [Lentisphaeria bacterium]|nr:right-handed parallel beta-helix repeat-containing protein [Lentisphaeria bacterium]
IVRRCRIEHGIRRIAVTDGASDNKILDNILSLGFACPKYFTSTDWKYNRLVYITFKYLVSNRQVSEDHSLVFDYSGPGNLVEGNVVYQGLSGTEANFSEGVTIRNNVFRELSSVGIVCSKGSKMEIAGNVMINNGINLRLHSFRWVPQGRTAYIHDNILYYTEGWGMQLFTLCTTAHPKAPEDVWFYHNTLINSNYFMNSSSFLRNYKGVPQPISIVNNLLVLDPKWKFTVPSLRLVAGNASAGEWNDAEKWGKTNAFHVPVEGEKPFLKAKDVPETKGKTVPLQKPSEVQGVSIPALPGMKDHSPLPGAQWDPKMIGMVRRSNELSVQAIEAMKSK